MDYERQQEEQWVLRAIYGDSILKVDNDNSMGQQTAYLLTVNVEDESVAESSCRSPRIMVLRLFFPSTYPSSDMPVFEIASLYCGTTRIDSDMVDTIQHRFQTMFQPGQVVLFEWIQWLRDYIQDRIKIATTISAFDEMALDTPATEKEETTPEVVDKKRMPDIFSSEPLVDRKSIFVAHVAHVNTVHQVIEVMDCLLENKKIARATHNIMAYRICFPGKHILQDNDDDGETAAGGRLMHLLQILDVKDVIVVVSRWFGGILLGPDRFKDINNCARKALDDCGYIGEK